LRRRARIQPLARQAGSLNLRSMGWLLPKVSIEGMLLFSLGHWSFTKDYWWIVAM